MTADVAASYSQMEQSYRDRGRGSVASSFSYSSQPRPLYYDSYRNLTDSAKPLYGNIMYDKRVIRGNTWALRRLAADALVKTSAEERQQMQERRRQIRQRVQSRLKNEQGGRKGKTSSGSGSIPVSAASSSSSTMRRRRNLTPPNIPSPRESPPLLGTRRSSTILEEEPNFDEKAHAYSSGDSGINLGGSARSIVADDDKEPENLPQIQTAEDAEISLPKPEADAIQTEETKQLEGVTADADAVGMEVQGAQKEVIPDRVEEDQKPSYGASEGDIRSAIPDDVMYLRIQSEAIVQTLLSISTSHVISLQSIDDQSIFHQNFAFQPELSAQWSTAVEDDTAPVKRNKEFYRGPILSPIDESLSLNPVLSSSAQTMVSELLESSINKMKQVSSGDPADRVISLIDQKIDTDQSISIHQYETVQQDLPPDDQETDFSLIDYCRYVIDQLIDAAVQNVFSLDAACFASEIAEVVVLNVVESSMRHIRDLTIRRPSEAIVEDLLESSVQRVVEISLTDAVADLQREDDATQEAWLQSQTAEKEWDKQLKELESDVLRHTREFLEEPAMALEQGSEQHEHWIPVSTVGVVAAAPHGESHLKPDSGINLVSKIDNLTRLLGQIDFDSIPIEANMIHTIREELSELRRGAEMEEQHKAQLIESYKIAIEDGNKYICRSIAQEYVASLLDSCMDQMEALGYDQQLYSTGQSLYGRQQHESIFNPENTVIFEEATSNDEAESITDIHMKLTRQIVRDVKKDLEPWLYGKAYAEVAREMTNLWLRDATGGRSRYCRCSAQRPLRRLLKEVETLQNQ